MKTVSLVILSISALLIMKVSFVSLLALTVVLQSCGGPAPENTPGPDTHNQRPRLLVTTDIGGDPDDTQSLIRLLVHSNQFDIEGLVASASGTPGELDTAVVRTDLIGEVIRQYEKVYPNLRLHDPFFPESSRLMKVVKGGNPLRGMDAIGPHGHTEGSRWIAERILHPDERPLNVCIWGGQTDLCQALWHLKDSLTKDRFNRTVSTLRIYDINDQDHIYHFFRDEFPGLFHILAKSPPGTDKREGAYRGMYLGGDELLTSAGWVNDHIKSDHGPLGALYPMKTWTAPNPHGCLKEGDTPSWFYFLLNGLQDPSRPGFGGWGGRFTRDSGTYFTDAADRVDSVRSARATVWRWRQAYQNEFAARMDWCLSPYREANHPPVAAVNGDTTVRIIRMPVPEDREILLDGGESFDPDGDSLSYSWWIYPEPGGSEDLPAREVSGQARMELEPEDLPGTGEIHLILEVTDSGDPQLTRYRRVVLQRE